MRKTLQHALLYSSTQQKLPGLQTQRQKCEVWQDQPFFHLCVTQPNESVHQTVRLGRSPSLTERSESSATIKSGLVALSSCALMASSKVRPLVWYTLKHGQAQRNLLHGAHRYLVFKPFGFLWHSAQIRCFRPPAFVGTISSGKCHSLKRCSGWTARILRAGLLNAWSRFPSSTRAKTTVDLNSA